MPVIHASQLTITNVDRVDLSVVEEPDASLITRALIDRVAFAPLYTRYAARIYWYCYLRLGTRELAEDATSVTLAKALTSLPTCQPDRFRAWLFQLARNVVADTFREHRHDSPLDDAIAVPDLSPSPEEIALRQEGHDTARALLAHLPENQRRIVELRLAGVLPFA
jgi:RNA polymerase sigma factor (sigma-70 family)